jgi:hypothetical protein
MAVPSRCEAMRWDVVMNVPDAWMGNLRRGERRGPS